MQIHVIKSEQDYEEAMNIIGTLLTVPEGSKEAEYLELLSILVEDYESKYYKIEDPDPISAIKFRIEQLGLTRKDLEKSIGSRSRVSEILNRKRNLTLPMIRKLHKNLNIPAEILINDTKRKLA